ncbi:MAG: Formate hydrogenlyase subunit 4 [Candidatus Omnitrophica bacterium ADurb.Bin292]|nr:MAG: Formate hydrogenlyase subunit 4 [Candidatus Omnitrophica bacterium ADurb.Bin292]HPW77047.1 NADH-quinone oxidoreductase subunit H [Candidatus Omnitrophota bacterium]
MPAIILSLFQVIFLMVLAPAVSWFIKRMKAASQNRRGPTLVQVYSDLGKLFRKDMVISETASWIFHLMPFVLFASTVAAALIVPVLGNHALLGFMGDAILFVYLFALGRFFLALAALDAGTTFGGMGSSREMTLSSLAEPAMLLAFFSLGFRSHTLSLGGMVSYFAGAEPFQVLFFTSLAFGALLIVTIAESGRIPVDNPATHLELTMIHEAMILEYSGRYLALIEWGHQIKQLVFLTLLANLFLPWGIAGSWSFPALGLALVLYLAKVFFLAFVIGWIEIHSAKLRLFRVPDFLSVAFVLAILSLLGQMIVGRGV